MAKLHFKHHYSSLQCHMILQKSLWYADLLLLSMLKSVSLLSYIHIYVVHWPYTKCFTDPKFWMVVCVQCYFILFIYFRAMMQDLKISEKLEGILISKGQKMHTSFGFASCVVCKNYVEKNITISQMLGKFTDIKPKTEHIFLRNIWL